jgi:hypothetical protein
LGVLKWFPLQASKKNSWNVPKPYLLYGRDPQEAHFITKTEGVSQKAEIIAREILEENKEDTALLEICNERAKIIRKVGFQRAKNKLN